MKKIKTLFNSFFTNIKINKWLYKLLLILVLLIIITVVIYNYTKHITSLKYNKFKEEKQKRVNKFIDEFKNNNNEEGFGFDTNQIENLWDDVWLTNATPFSLNSSFKKSFGYLYENDNDIEGFEFMDIFKEDTYKDGINGINDSLMGPINKILDGINEAIDWITHFKENVLDPITGGFQGIYDYILSLKARFTKLGNGIVGLFTAIGNSFDTIFAKALPVIVNDVASLVYGGGRCLVHFGGNFRSCLIFWIMDLIAEIIYNVFVLLPVYIIDAIIPSLDLMSYVEQIKSWIKDIDDIFIDIIGYSCIHYPSSVLNDCYMCGEVDFTRKVRELNDDTSRLNSAFDSLGQDYKTAFYEIGGFFQDEYYRKLDAIKSGDPKKMFSEFNPAPITTAFVKGAVDKNKDKPSTKSDKKYISVDSSTTIPGTNILGTTTPGTNIPSTKVPPKTGLYENEPSFAISGSKKNSLSSSIVGYGVNYAIYSAVKSSKN